MNKVNDVKNFYKRSNWDNFSKVWDSIDIFIQTNTKLTHISEYHWTSSASLL